MLDFWAYAKATEAQATAQDSKSRANKAQREVDELTDRLDKLSLICQAMWSLLQERAGLTEEDLLKRVQEIDMQDGRADGKVAKSVLRCSQCERVMAARHQRCLYCGAERQAMNAFDIAQ